MLNLCVVHEGDGGDVLLEKSSEMSDAFLSVFVAGLMDNAWQEVTLEEGLKEVDEYFDGGSRTEEEKKEYKDKRDQFADFVNSEEHEGEYKLYVWGIEYDIELMFVGTYY